MGHLTQKDQSVLGRVVTFGHPRGGDLECVARKPKVVDREEKKNEKEEEKGHERKDNVEADCVSFTLVDQNGIHDTKVYFCQCPYSHGTKNRRLELLMQSRIFPSTAARASVGFTFEVMADFHVHTLTSKKSAYDYMDALQRKTNAAFPHDIKVCT